MGPQHLEGLTRPGDVGFRVGPVRPLREHEHAVRLVPARERGRRGVDPGGCTVSVVEKDAGHSRWHPLEGVHHHVDRRVG
jgi:hypothetical protein